MPLPKELPQKAKDLWEGIYEKSKTEDCDEACAAAKAWSAIKRAYEKNEDGEWVKKKSQALQQFGMTIKSFGERDGEMYWRADCSDTDDDLAGDNMTIELFKAFIERIDKNEPAPEEYQSEFWQGGMPYLSISHYTDQDGSAVPGEVKAVFLDGTYLKSKGILQNTSLGKAVFKSLQEDKELELPVEKRVRISIGFLDYKHEHKSDGYIFERKSIDDWCPACLREMILGESAGRKFIDGQLVHLAMTRVPMNTRTLMELEEKSMTTKVEDAASIVGEEKAAQFAEVEKKSVEKAAFVTKSDLEQFSEVLKSLNDRLASIEEKMSNKDMEEDEEDDEETEDEKEKKKKKMDEKSQVDTLAEILKGVVESNTVLASKMDLVATAVSEIQKAPAPDSTPARRGVTHVQRAQITDPNKPMGIREFVYSQQQ